MPDNQAITEQQNFNFSSMKQWIVKIFILKIQKKYCITIYKNVVLKFESSVSWLR